MHDSTHTSVALLTDLYQLTMAAAYHASGLDTTEACFHLFFRNAPFEGGYAIACGLDQAIAYLDGLRFSAEDIAYLAEDDCSVAQAAWVLLTVAEIRRNRRIEPSAEKWRRVTASRSDR